MRSITSLRSFPKNDAFETVPMFVWLTKALSRPFKEDRLALPWNGSSVRLTDDGPLSSFHGRSSSASSKRFQCSSDWRWPSLVLSRKIVERFLFPRLSSGWVMIFSSKRCRSCYATKGVLLISAHLSTRVTLLVLVSCCQSPLSNLRNICVLRLWK